MTAICGSLEKVLHQVNRAFWPLVKIDKKNTFGTALLEAVAAQ
jgi:hypothetical protein